MNVRNMIAVALTGAVVLLAPGCYPDFPSEGNGGNGGQHERPVPPGETVEVKHGESTVYKNIEIIFLGVLEDSRCPTDVECLWAGNARLAFAFGTLPGGMAQRFELNTNSTFPQSVEYGDYVITLAQLQPEPISSVPIDPRDYVATLQFEKK